MKGKLLITASAIIALFSPVSAKEYVTRDLVATKASIEGVGTTDFSVPSYSCRIRVDEDMTLFIDQRGYHVFPNSLPTSVKLDITDDEIRIVWECDEHEPDILGSITVEASYKMYALEKGDYTIRFKNYRSSTPLSLAPGKEYLLSATDGDEMTVTEGWPISQLFTSRTATEWVLYNEKLGSDDMFRLRLGDCKGKGEERVWPVLMSRGKKFDIHNAETIAFIGGGTGEYTVHPADVDLPAEFWGTGLPEKRYNPAAIMGDVSRKMYDFWLQGNNYYFDVLNNRFDEIEGSKPFYTPSRTGAYRRMSLSNGGEWIEGLGAVGDGYASNLPYPVYSLPENVSPTHLLYIRDLTTNEIIYGDPSLDKGYLGICNPDVSDLPVTISGISSQYQPREERLTSTRWMGYASHVWKVTVISHSTFPLSPPGYSW